jgi:tetratricopeptide (TPR) repeat protein
MKLTVAAGALALVSIVACTPVALHAQALRPAVGKPLEAARSMLAAHNYAKAMAEVRQADGVAGKTAHEQAVIDQMRAAIAQQSGDTATASAAYRKLLDSGAVSGVEAQRLIESEASIAYGKGEWANVIYWSDRYNKAGGTDPAVRAIYVSAYYKQGNYAQAARLVSAQIAAETHGGRPPREEQLQLLYSCQQHLNDKAGELATIKQLVTYYPKADYWLNVIDNLRTKPGFSDRLLLDVYRLEFSLGLVNKPDDAMDYAELALQAKLPGEAKDVVDRSFAGGLLGTGPEASRHERLRALVDKSYAATKAQLGHDDVEAASDHDGNRLLALGETYVSFGDFAHGVPMIEQAVRKDELRHPDDAKLQLGLAYWKSGDKRHAVAELRSVGGNDGVADLAQLWILRIQSAKS